MFPKQFYFIGRVGTCSFLHVLVEACTFSGVFLLIPIHTHSSPHSQLIDAKTGQVKSKDFRGPPVLYVYSSLLARFQSQSHNRGSVALSSTNETFVSWTGECFQLFRLVGLELLQTFATGRPMVYFPRNIVFGEQDRIVVGGTDRGCGRIFQVDDPNKTQILEYPKGGLVQHVAVSLVISAGCLLINIARRPRLFPTGILLQLLDLVGTKLQM